MTLESDFIQPDEKKGLVVVKVNARVFPLDLVYDAAYSIMDRAYVILDGLPDKEIYVILKPRTFKGKLDDLGRSFYDELVAAAFHAVQFVRNKDVRDALIESMAPLTSDEEDIATLWEEKFGEGIEGSIEEGK